ncbi:MAG: prolipoprotein diacylglyceryl transferase family protein [Polyangiaceae bacterium]
MIPFIHVPDIHVGVTLHPFGLLVATGVLVGTQLAHNRARKLGYDNEKLSSFIMWMLVVGFMGGHMLDEVFYHPREIVQRPWSLFMLWDGLSSFGGFVGAAIGIVLWKYFEAVPRQHWYSWPLRRRAVPASVLAFSDLILAVFPIAWIFGRSGCSVVHDHPGARAPADSIWAVGYPTASHGTYIPADVPRTKFGPIELVHGAFPRYDLGLLELMFTCVIAVIFVATWRRKLPIGTYLVMSAFLYSPVRFVMDFVRITDGESADIRYGNLTFAQWCCVALFAYGVWVIFYMRSIKARGIDLAETVRAPAELPMAEPTQA